MLLLEVVYKLEEISKIAGRVLLSDPSNKIFLFEGDMGAGKTTLIKEMSRALGSEDNFSSPTFSIVNDYHFKGGTIHHFDLYRLNTEEELYDIGFEEYLSSGNYCFIEWPAKALSFLDDSFLKVKIDVISEQSRKIRVTRTI
jgi:tRNA threonylcarbamoyladenosine biosynthesis protein TsaE